MHTAEGTSDARPVPDYGAFRAQVGLSDDDIVVTKRNWSAVDGTELYLELRPRKVTGIVLAGIATAASASSSLLERRTREATT